MSSIRVFLGAAALFILGLAGCGESSSTPDAGSDAAVDATVDVGTPDATVDAAVDAGSDADAASDAGADDATYNDFTDAGLWSKFDTTSVDAGAAGYWGGTFDGRYIYMPSYHNVYGWDGMVTRYDTQSPLGSASSWSVFDTKNVDSNLSGFYGAAFDGRYVYLVPPASTTSGLVARYDTQAAFDATASWSTFDATTVNVAAKGFVGAVFDGRYVYFVPYSNGLTSYSGTVARYDTQAAFGATGSWATFDTRGLTTSASGFFGGVFDGRYVYFVPDANGTSGTVTRYDTQGAFGSNASWSTFDTTGVDANAKGFQTGAFDGRYVYFVPGHGLGTVAIVARYDTTVAFGTAGAWSTFDTTAIDAAAKGFASSAFDGRYVYLVPHFTGSSPAFSGLLVRYDTRAAFGAAPSWTKFDLTTLDANAVGFEGAVFDGRYVYLLPSITNSNAYGGLVVRFDAKSPPGMPALPAFSGSFL